MRCSTKARSTPGTTGPSRARNVREANRPFAGAAGTDNRQPITAFRLRPLALLCVLACLPADGGAQRIPVGTGTPPSATAPGPVAATPRGVAVAASGPHSDARARQYAEFCRLARDRIERAMLRDPADEAGRRPLAAEAERFARSAAELMPGDADGWFLLAAALGLRAEFEPFRRQVQTVAEVRQAALTALDRDSAHAGGHHVMGRLNYEAMRLPGVSRTIATRVLGSTLTRDASWESAERHLRRAAELEPDVLVHHLWLARTLAARGSRDAARREYQGVLSRPARSELDRRWQEMAGQELGAL